MRGYPSQSCCPFNIKFAQALKEPAFAPRGFIAGKDARTLAENLLATEQADFSAAFRKSPMKRAKRAGLQRNARTAIEASNERPVDSDTRHRCTAEQVQLS